MMSTCVLGDTRIVHLAINMSERTPSHSMIENIHLLNNRMHRDIGKQHLKI